MQLKNINLIALLLLGLSLSAVTSCSQASETKLTWKSSPTQDSLMLEAILIDVVLPSGVEVKGIVFGQERLAKRWLLQIKKETASFENMTIFSNLEETNSLSEQDFSVLFTELISFIKDNNGQLDEVQLGLGVITELWQSTASSLRDGIVPSSYKLTGKDQHLANIISSYLKESLILKSLCENSMQIQRVCKSNFVGMNPIAFELDYIGKEWNQVDELPNLGIKFDKIWFGVELTNAVTP